MKTKPLTADEIQPGILIDLGSQRIERLPNGKTSLVVDTICIKCGHRTVIRVGSIRYRMTRNECTGFCMHCFPRHKPKWRGGSFVNGGYRWVHRDLVEPEIIAAFDKAGFKFSRRKRYIQEHRVVAFRKYGDAALAPDVLIRHRDGNKLNNTPGNLLLGSHQDNKNDHMTSIREAASWRSIALSLFWLLSKSSGKG
jgi:hypothetical protein